MTTAPQNPGPTSLVVGLYREFFELNLVNTYFSIILTNAAFNLAFATWILQGFFSSIPKEVEEAANLDGCGRFGTLWRVMLPLTRPGLSTLMVFQFMAAWNAFLLPLVMVSNPNRFVVTVGLSTFQGAHFANYGALAAGSVLAALPVVAVYLLSQRSFITGMFAGSAVE